MATITKIEFYNGNPTSGGVKIGEDLTSPYSINWNTTGVGAGAKTIYARAILSDGTFQDSAAVNITVNSVSGTQVETQTFMNSTNLQVPNDATVFHAGTAYERTGAQLWTAVDNLVVDLKAAGIYTKMQYLRPRVKGTALAHATDLINPANVGTYSLGWTHSGAGAQSTATNSSFNTGFNPRTSQIAGDSGLTVSVIADANTLDNAPIIGAYTADGDNAMMYAIKLTAGNYFRVRYNAGAVSFGTVDPVGRTGVMTVSRVGGSNSFRYFHKGVMIHTGDGTGVNPDKNLYEATINGLSVSSWQGTLGVTAAHQGLTDTEAAALNTAIENFELALGRKTW